jgi:hypothetical protein
MELVGDLKSLDMRQKGNATPSEIAEAGSRKSNTIAELLDQCIEDLFVPYTEGDRYIEKEKKSLNELYSSLLLQFNAYHVSENYFIFIDDFVTFEAKEVCLYCPKNLKSHDVYVMLYFRSNKVKHELEVCFSVLSIK